MRHFLPSALALATLVSVSFAQGPVFSGPQTGEKLAAFKVQAFSGPAAGKQFQLLVEPKENPRVLVFVHEITRPALQLLRPVDQYAAKLAPEGFEAHFIWLTSDKTKLEQFLNNATQSLSLKAPIVISLDGIEGPGNYGLNRKMALTVLVAKGDKVVANFAIIQPNETDAPKVTAAMAKLVGKDPPTAAELGLQPKPPPGREKAKPPASPELQLFMRKMIQLTNDEAAIKTIADDMRKWAGDNPARQTELRNYCQTILQLDYGTEACKKALAELARK